MPVKVAINGYGRIGRMALRALYEANRRDELQIVAINSLGTNEINAHLTQYDSTHGHFDGEVKLSGDSLWVKGDEIRLYSERDPAQLRWGDLDIDIVMECSGHFTTRDKASLHLKAGAKKVLISAPAGSDVDATIVYGVNHHVLQANHTVVSNASCTTNCLAPLVKALHDALKIQHGFMTTIHAYTNDQVLSDVTHSDLRRARSATQSMIPTKTGAAKSIGLVMPELEGKLDGYAMRVPVLNVSVVDLTVLVGRSTSVNEVNQVLKAAVDHNFKEIAAINTLPLVSCDFNHHPASSIFDLTQTKVIDNMVNVLAWYDNEWGFSNRMLDTALVMANA